ncbi:phage minor capsid protein [Pelosinus propionicus]|uniref:Phage minor capsid protein 2 n=1 Tax=Pelosinus propionicus DSM 13327 TaxID=1123291 RepID=A0A1I4QCD4_9FIRM|nr:phage minor capsid protein [Pelosinus propionicus]SFM37761.1 Phage minor capsid protein 2 [Pelosinus propionicus DSM 13327]
MEAPLNEFEKLMIAIYLQAETNIIAIIARKEKQDYVTYAEKAALSRIHKILKEITLEAVALAPKLTETAFLHGAGLSVGRKKAAHIISEGSNRKIVELLTKNLTGELTDAARHVGRTINDAWRSATLEAAAAKEAGGYGAGMTYKLFQEKVLNEGLMAFQTSNGADWSLRTYANMAVRAVTREATNSGTLFADPDHDLYQISSHASSCPICAPLEGRIYSRSGLSAEFPSLTKAFFSRKDKNGPDNLDNSYLNIHPNCRHVLIKWVEEAHTAEEIEEAKTFSNRDWKDDPRSRASIEAYRKSQRVRRQLHDDYEQYQRYQLRLDLVRDDFPKTFQTFQRVKQNNPERYAKWRKIYREIGQEIKRG